MSPDTTTPATGERPVLFVSDLHLSPDQPDVAGRFLRWLDDVASRARAVYILGDLFEAWPGDDYLDDPFVAPFAQALRRLSEADIELGLCPGNRDFLLGERFRQSVGAHLLADSALITVYGTPTLIMHGDTLCTDDLAYQAFRQQTRQPAWQAAVLARPLPERLAMARQLRAESSQAKDQKSMAIMDVNAEAVAAAFRDQHCWRLIHGHTHRPARHVIDIDGHTCERWVLPDWDLARGGYLACDSRGCAAHDF